MITLTVKAMFSREEASMITAAAAQTMGKLPLSADIVRLLGLDPERAWIVEQVDCTTSGGASRSELSLVIKSDGMGAAVDTL